MNNQSGIGKGEKLPLRRFEKKEEGGKERDQRQKDTEGSKDKS